jgi:hypothetical protein
MTPRNPSKPWCSFCFTQRPEHLQPTDDMYLFEHEGGDLADWDDLRRQCRSEDDCLDRHRHPGSKRAELSAALTAFIGQLSHAAWLPNLQLQEPPEAEVLEKKVPIAPSPRYRPLGRRLRQSPFR